MVTKKSSGPAAPAHSLPSTGGDTDLITEEHLALLAESSEQIEALSLQRPRIHPPSRDQGGRPAPRGRCSVSAAASAVRTKRGAVPVKLSIKPPVSSGPTDKEIDDLWASFESSPVQMTQEASTRLALEIDRIVKGEGMRMCLAMLTRSGKELIAAVNQSEGHAAVVREIVDHAKSRADFFSALAEVMTTVEARCLLALCDVPATGAAS